MIKRQGPQDEKLQEMSEVSLMKTNPRMSREYKNNKSQENKIRSNDQNFGQARLTTNSVDDVYGEEDKQADRRFNDIPDQSPLANLQDNEKYSN